MSVRPSGVTNANRPTSPIDNDGNSSAAHPATPDEQPQVIRGNRHELLKAAPRCAKDWAAGKMPTTAGTFNTCVGWLARNHQHEGLRDLLSSPKCSHFDTLDLHGEPLDGKALGVLAFHLDRSSVTKLNLSGCQLETQEHADGIGELLGPGSKLQLFNLSQNKLGDATVTTICKSLSTNGTLQHLGLRGCALNVRNYCDLLRVLCDVRAMKEEGPRKEAKNKTLQTLCLADNQLINPTSHTKALDRELMGRFGPVAMGRMPGMRWLDLSNTGITLSSTLTGWLTEFRCPRLDLAGNPFSDRTVAELHLWEVTHLNLQGITLMDHYDMGATQYSALELLVLPGLRVLDLRGAHPRLLEVSEPLLLGESLICLRLDREVAEAPAMQAIPGLTPLSSGDLVGPGGGFLAFWSPPGLSPHIGQMPGGDVSERTFAKKLDEELDARSIASLMTVNKALSASKGPGLEQALRRHTEDPGFDWDEATMIARDAPAADDVAESLPVNVLTTTTSLTATTVATTTTTTDFTMRTATTGTGAPGS